jgi:hypothetical protein
MSVIGIAGLLLALAAVYVAEVKGSKRRLVVFVLMFVLHTLASVANYFVSEASGSDAHFYYYDSHQFFGYSEGLGTPFILNIVQYLRMYFGGSFFEYFLLFQAAGFWGLVFIYKTIHEIFAEVSSYQPTWAYLFLFLPGLHFWTGAIGKDALIFMAIAISIWASQHMKKRLFALGLSIALMMAVRPHIAILALASLCFAAFFDRRTGLLLKAALVAGVVAGTVVVAMSLETTIRVDVSSSESVSDYMSARTALDENSGADRAIIEGSLPLKVFTLWFRPFFLDAENSMGYIASLENLVLLLLFGFLAWNWRLLRTTFAKVLYIRYATMLFIALTVLLAAVNYNVGLGLRQKMMAMPCLLIILMTLIAVRSGQREEREEVGGAHLQPVVPGPAITYSQGR